MNDETKKYEILRPIAYKGDRVERGTVLELTDEEVANIGAENLQEAMDEETNAAVEETPTEEAAVETTPTEAPAEAGETAGDEANTEASEPAADAVEETPTEEAPASEGAESQDQE
jgi:hypothetical protein